MFKLYLALGNLSDDLIEIMMSVHADFEIEQKLTDIEDSIVSLKQFLEKKLLERDKELES